MTDSHIIKAIVADDELHAIELFEKVAGLFENNLSIVATAQSLPDCIKLIHIHKPDVVFLDIDMPNYSGLQIQDFFGAPKNFELVFVTAHSEYAIEALRLSAFDYLLKPLELTGLQKCLIRLEEKFRQQRLSAVSSSDLSNQRGRKIAVNTHQGTYFVDVENILFIEASSMYSVIHTADEQIIVSKPLMEFDYLKDNLFFRVHRSYLVNTGYIRKFSNSEGSEIELKNGKRIPVSRIKKDAFKHFMNTYGKGC